ncbi:MAG: nucleotidyltransferase domain-containing protein [Bacteroidia bacterium]|nr:nucleotidyltransferase domain-containing protein [Bacteroidia bacterium]
MDRNDSVLNSTLEIIINNVKPDKIILFGSRATGKADEHSDYDLCILKREIKNKRKLVQRLYRLLYGINSAVDIIAETSEKFEELKDVNSLIYRNIYLNGIVLYER